METSATVSATFIAGRNYFAGSHLQRTGDTIAPSFFSSAKALSTSLRSMPVISAILPALTGSPNSRMACKTFSFIIGDWCLVNCDWWMVFGGWCLVDGVWWMVGIREGEISRAKQLRPQQTVSTPPRPIVARSTRPWGQHRCFDRPSMRIRCFSSALPYPLPRFSGRTKRSSR